MARFPSCPVSAGWRIRSSTPGIWPPPAADKPGSNLDRSPPKILLASSNGLAPRFTTLLLGDGFSATACRQTCRGAIQRAATLIFIADWSNYLRRKLPEVGLAESSLRQGGYRRCVFGEKGRMDKIKRELRLRCAVTLSATSIPDIASAAYREDSR